MGNKKNWFKRSLVLLLTLMLVCNGMSRTMLTVFAEEETTVPETAVEEQAAELEDSRNADGAEWFTGEGTISLADIDIPDNDELFEGYVDQLFFGNLNGGISLFGNFGLSMLPEESKAIYNELKPWIQQVAAGTAPRDTDVSSSMTTQKALTGGLTLSLTDDEWKEIESQTADSDATQNIVLDKLRPQMRAITNYLLMDNPYDFYWYDKTKGYRYGYSYRINKASKDISVVSINMKFAVSTNFSPEGIDADKRLYLVDTGLISLAKTAVETAKAIVEKYKGKSDYEKLDGYRREICELTSYNYDAVNNEATPYGNPWQLIWVFDKDPATEVVCEGYSKAFQYLCDLSDLTDAICYTVSGYMNGGGHMWNIVTLEGENYLVDVTNCDGNSIGKPDKLFLAGTSGNVADGYTFQLSKDVLYTYDDDHESLFGSEILTLANKRYTPKLNSKVTIDSVEVTYGDAVESSVLAGSASTEGGTDVAGTFAWASDVTSYGTVGTKEIKAVFTPNNPDYSPQTVTVKVTVNRKPITVTADAKEKTYGGEEPELTYTIDGKTPLVGDDKLSGKLTRAAGEDVKDGGYSITQGTLTDKNNPNYHIVFTPGTFTITPAEYSGKKEDTKQTKYGNSDTYDLASLLPAGAKLGAVNTSDAEGIFVEEPMLNGTVLSYKLNSDTGKIGKTAVITVPVTETTNYNPFTITITVALSDKLPQTDFKFDIAEVNKVYGAGDFTVTAKNAVSGSIVTYTISDPAVAQVDAGGKVHILKKGSAVITAAASETEDYTGRSVTYKLTISPKPLAWDVSVLYARDKQGEVTDKAASLYGELRVSGILSSDGSKVVFNCPASKLTGTYADEKPGQKKVTLAWAGGPAVLEGEGADNYTMPSELPEIAGIINVVSEQENVPESTEAVQYKLEIENGISEIPDTLKAINNLDTPVKIEGRMKSEVKQKLSSVSGVEVYDVVLMVNKDNGVWEAVTSDSFPKDGITVTLPYPTGTGKDTHNFTVVHMFTVSMNGHAPGEVENPAVTKTDAGIQFKVTSLSPIAVGAEEIRSTVSDSATDGANSASGSANDGANSVSGSTADGANSVSGTNAVARTGDESNILLYVLLMMLGAAGIGFSAKRKIVR